MFIFPWDKIIVDVLTKWKLVKTAYVIQYWLNSTRKHCDHTDIEEFHSALNFIWECEEIPKSYHLFEQYMNDLKKYK